MEKTLEELKIELARKNDLIEDLGRNFDRINFILCEWIQDYSFRDTPDPRKALQWGQTDNDDIHCTQSAKWFLEYGRIHDLIEVGVDYTRYSRQLIENSKV